MKKEYLQMQTLTTAKKSDETLKYLLGRRSCPIKMLQEPGPDKEQIKTILQAASRVPDHGKMFPWYFIVFQGDNRKKIGETLKKAWLCNENPDATQAKLELEAERFMRAPVVIAVISRVRKGKHPLWEQILSAGAVCQNLSIAANTLGYATNWLTEWYSYNDTFRNELGLDKCDHIAGFIYIGTPKEIPKERERPDLNEIITWWKPGVKPQKGNEYSKPGKEYPQEGFDFSGLGKIEKK